jgi:hypothetical protein
MVRFITRKITEIRDLGTEVEVTDGVKQGDQVVLTPPVDLEDGSKYKFARPRRPNRHRALSRGALLVKDGAPIHGGWPWEDGERVLFGTYPAVSCSVCFAFHSGKRFAARKSTNTLSLGGRWRLDGHRTRRVPEESV